MDPDALLADIQWTITELCITKNPDYSELLSLFQDLNNWLEKSGLEPNWMRAPIATWSFQGWKSNFQIKEK